MHTAGVVVVNVTVSSDDDVALTVTGDCSVDLSANVAERDRLRRSSTTPKLCVTDGAGSKMRVARLVGLHGARSRPRRA